MNALESLVNLDSVIEAAENHDDLTEEQYNKVVSLSEDTIQKVIMSGEADIEFNYEDNTVAEVISDEIFRASNDIVAVLIKEGLI